MIGQRWTRALAVMALVFSGLVGPANPAVSTARAATTLDVCGTVLVYVEPTIITAGALTIGPIANAVASGTTVPSSVRVGADLCVRLTLNTGSITNLVVLEADATTSVKICGAISAFAAATSRATGSLTIAGRTFKIAAGESLPASVKAGAHLCLDLDLNALGQIRNGTVKANATATVKICGEVTAYAAATLTSTGSLKIAGRTFTLALSSDLPASVKVGADLCLELELNGFGQVQDGSATADVTATVKICGDVTAYAAASLTKNGSLKIAGRTFVLGLGSDLPASVKVGADLCLTLKINAFGQVKGGTAVANVSTTVEVCGTVTAYAAATLTKTGSLTIDGRSWVVGLGATLPAAVKAGADLCLTLHLNAFGQVKDGTAVAFVTSSVDVCGQVTAVTAATATSQGSLSHAGTTRAIAPGATLSSQVKAGAYLKLRLKLDVFGRIDDDIVLAAAASLAEACGAANPNPTPTPAPSGTLAPSGTPSPTGSVAPTASTSSSATPGGSAGPSGSPDPSGGPSAGPSQPPATPSDGTDGTGKGPTCEDEGVLSGNAWNGGDLAGGPLPDTASLGRTGGLVVVASVPLFAIGGVLLGMWLATARRRRDELVPVSVDPSGEGSR